jgi:hypothetical protein
MVDSGTAGSAERGRGPRRWIVALRAVLLVVGVLGRPDPHLGGHNARRVDFVGRVRRQ